MEAFPGLPERSAGRELTEAAYRLAKEKKIDFYTALIEVARQLPSLAEEAGKEALRGHAPSQAQDSGPSDGFRNKEELHRKILEREAQKGISYSAAKKEIEAEEPELTANARREGGMDIKDVVTLPNGVRMIHCTEFGKTYDPNGLLARITANRAKRAQIDYKTALSDVRRDYPELTRAADLQVMGVERFIPD
jgi:hypothetical protein